MTKKQVEYDSIAGEYKESKQLSFRKYVEEYSLFELLGDVRNKRVLDLACGEGFYTRKIKQAGAADILGVDLSGEMIRLAEKEEAIHPLGCSYMKGDARHLDIPGSYDVITAMYLLNYARRKQDLLGFCKTAYRLLNVGGWFLGVNDNMHVHPRTAGSYKNYGFEKKSPYPWKDGLAIRYTFSKPDGTTFEFDNFYLSPQTYEDAFRESGFRSFEWKGPYLSPEQHSNAFWSDFMAHPPIIGFIAQK